MNLKMFTNLEIIHELQKMLMNFKMNKRNKEYKKEQKKVSKTQRKQPKNIKEKQTGSIWKARKIGMPSCWKTWYAHCT